MSITRWDPVADAIGLRQVMDSLLEQSFVRPREDGGGGALGLAVDVQDRGEAFVVEAAIPGSAPEDVEISVTGDVVRIRAERRDTREEGDPSGRFLVREQRFGAFERVLRLPAPVDAGAAQAEFRTVSCVSPCRRPRRAGSSVFPSRRELAGAARHGVAASRALRKPAQDSVRIRAPKPTKVVELNRGNARG